MPPSVRLPVELWMKALKILHEDRSTNKDLCGVALVNTAFNTLAAPLVYQRVNLKAVPTLLASPHLCSMVQSADLDATQKVLPLDLSEHAAVQLQLSRTLHAGLKDGRPAAHAALLSLLCPALHTLHAIFSPRDAGLFTLYVFLEPFRGLQHVTHFTLAPPPADADAPVPAYFSLDVLTHVLRLPCIRAVRASSLLCDAPVAHLLGPPARAPSTVQHLVLTDVQLSARALAHVLRAAPRLKTLALTYWPDLGEPEPLDLDALGAALLGVPGLQALRLTLSGACGDEYVGALTRLRELPGLRRLAVPVQFLGLQGEVTGDVLQAVVPDTVEHLELGWLASMDAAVGEDLRGT